VDATGGPNGIANIDPFHIEGHQLTSLRGYFWVALTAFAVVIVGLHLVSASRTGRAWRALREDPYAAELLGMPVNRLKLVAFAFGAGVAGLTGTLFAALNSAVFTADFDVPLLITVYAMVVLGGTGSLKGVAVGAIVVNVTLEVLRTPGHATWVFYGLVVITIAARVRPRRWAATVLGGLVGLGFAVHAIVAAEWPSWAQRPTGAAGTLLRHWILVVGPNQAKVGNYAFILLVVAVIALLELKGRARTLALIPLAYLAAFAWENRLVVEPSVTRLIFLGVLLILLMNARPQGLLGTARVEIA
jgi:ABC-type branched-subunit amino acid transport system permease subunit